MATSVLTETEETCFMDFEMEEPMRYLLQSPPHIDLRENGSQPAAAGLESDTGNIGSMSKRSPDATQDMVTNKRANWTDSDKRFLLVFLKEQERAGSGINWDQVAQKMKENSPNSDFTIEQLKQKKQDLRKLYRMIKGKPSDPHEENIPYYAELVDYFKGKVKPRKKVHSAMSRCIKLFNQLKGHSNIDIDRDIVQAVEIFKSDKNCDAFETMNKKQRAVWIKSMIDGMKGKGTSVHGSV